MDGSRLRQILDSAIDYGIIVMDLDGLVVLWSDGAARTLGWSEAEMIGKPASLFFTSEDRRAGVPQAEIQAALKRGRGNDERWHCRKDGSRFWADGEMMPLHDEDGVIHGLVKVLRDRTEHRKDFERQRSEAQLMRSVLAASNDCIKVLDLDGKLAFMSEGGQRVMEVSDFGAIKGCPWPDFWRGNGHLQAMAAIETARAGGTGRFQGLADTMAGRSRFWDVQVTAMLGDDGKPEKLLSVSRDVSEIQGAREALRDSETHWRGLFQSLHEGFILGEVVRDHAGKVVDWRYMDVNAAWGELVGIASETAIGRTIRELFPGIEDIWVDEIAAVVDTRIAATFTRQVGDLRRWYEGRAFALDQDRFAVLFVEVTQRARADARRLALLELDDRLRDMDDPSEMSFAAAEIMGSTLGVDIAGYGSMEDDDETLVIASDWTVPGAASIRGRHLVADYGTHLEDLRLGRDLAVDDVHTDSRMAPTRARWDAIASRAMINLPLIENGRLVALFFVLAAEPRSWAREEVDFVRTVGERLRSAVERRRAEHDLRALAASLEQQVEARTQERDRVWRVSQDLIVVIDTAGVFLAVNPAVTKMLGWAPAEWIGHSLFDFLHAEDAPSTDDALERAATDALPTYLNRYRHKDGSLRWISWVAAPEDGRIYATGRDVTAEKEQALALEQAQEALRQSQKMEAVGQLTGGLAHDFNNLLAGISGSLELMQARMNQGRLKDVDRYILAAQGATTRAAALTHRLLAFSRRQTLDPKPTNVNKLVHGMEDLIRRTVGPGIRMEVVGTAALWSVLVDPPQLENALLNLCINARDAMPDGGRITIETHNKWLDERAARERDMSPGQYLSICVGDTGTGMPADVIAKAFDPFFTTKPIGQGTGLGLSMIYGFARQSGGQVRIYSEVGEGTNVCMYLPRHYVEEVEDAPPVVLKADRAEQGETVLIVDDEPTVRMLVTEVLEDLGYTAIEAADSAAGLKVLQSDVRIDLLVTDVGLPGGMNGRQMADAGRVNRADLKVLFITGYAENAAIGHGHLSPGMQVMTKPFVMESLASRIRSMIVGQ